MSKHKNGKNPVISDEKPQNTTEKSILSGRNEKNDGKPQNATEKAEETTKNEFSDEKDVKIDEKGQNPTNLRGETEAENLALRAEIAGLRGELDALHNHYCDWIYALSSAACNQPLISHGATPVADLRGFDFAGMCRHWQSSQSEQMSMFDLL